MAMAFPGSPGFPALLWERFNLPQPSAIHGPYWGFSGAPTWKIDCYPGNWALKRLKLNPAEFSRRASTHKMLALIHGLHKLPVPFPRGLQTLDGWGWECLSWCQGQEILPHEAKESQGSIAAGILGRIHRAMAQIHPGSFRDIAKTTVFEKRIINLGKGITKERAQGLSGSFGELVSSLDVPRWNDFGKEISSRLCRWQKAVWVQTIHGDPHVGNWLWLDGQVSGLIDFLGTESEPRELDLARLWGSYGIETDQLNRWIEAYESSSGGPPLDGDLIRLLEASGVWIRIQKWAMAMRGSDCPEQIQTIRPSLKMHLDTIAKNARYWLRFFGYC